MHRSGAGLLIGAALLCGAASAQAPNVPPQALFKLEKGQWELRAIGGNGAPLRLCLGDRRQLFQPLHPAPMCRQFVATDDATHATVSYDCAQRGQGRTDLRVETSRLIQLDSQGVTNGRPFATRFEGRHVGACPGR